MPSTPASDQRVTYHFCTYFDQNYLTRGLALYLSLEEHCHRPFVLWTLCFDDETYATLSRLGLEGMRLIGRADFEAGDDALAAARANRSPVEYYWTCTPSLPLYVLNQDASIQVITYLDADLFFYSDPQPIFAEFADASILIHGHRYAPAHAHFAATSGIYNVGLLSFRRDAAGLQCLQWWRERCNEWCYARFENGKYGDQKYLDDWPARFPGVHVLQHPGAGLAPWNVARHEIVTTEEGTQVDGVPLIFYHFHALKVVSPWVVEPTGKGYCYPLLSMTRVYRPYLGVLRRAAAMSGRPLVDAFARSGWRNTLKGLLRQELWLFRPNRVGNPIWRYGPRAARAEEWLFDANQSIQQGDRHGGLDLLKRALTENPAVVFGHGFRVAIARYLLGNGRFEWIKRALRRGTRDTEPTR